MTKTCTKCGAEKDVSEFNKDNQKKDGYRSSCKVCSKKYADEYTRLHRDMKNASSREYYHKTREKQIERSKKYRQNNIERERERSRVYHKKNPDKTLARKRRRRARKYGVEEHYTKEDRKYTMDLFDHQCAVCGSTHDLCIDHHYPLSKGYALSRTNAVVLCTKHNLEKHDKLPEEFYTSEQLLILSEKLNPSN